MADCINLSKVLLGIVLGLIVSAPAIAHEIEVAAGVAGLWHLEPDHNPQAGQPAQVWIALTREGGQVLPLSQANCQLAVYRQPQKPTDLPVLQPILKPITAEKYQGIPGAEVIFPQVGLYRLQLNCRPKVTGSFQPFEMSYQVTVAGGVAAQPSPQPSTQAVPSVKPPAESAKPVWIIGSISAAMLLGLGIFKLATRR